MTFEAFAEGLYASIALRRVDLPPRAGADLSHVCIMVARWLDDHPGKARQLLRHYMAPAARLELLEPQALTVGIAALLEAVERHGCRTLGGEAYAPPEIPRYHVDPVPFACPGCGGRTWKGLPVHLEDRVGSVSTVMAGDDGAPHRCPPPLT